ncbi:MOSC domain-containing protein [uncultured Clostridium sp.]|uniref:MOSC domain-containing protein n=1 Tax=uncultured Clostridium sp. TaxID=59620 RepID=UPI002635FB67|nr:MOSC domain-containing protein [uncultured Clostridium sp.]
MGKLVSICISEKKGIGKTQITEIELIGGFGLKGDAHGGKWHRQVSLLEKEKIEDFIKRGGNVKFGDFGENLVTEGIDLDTIKVGDKITVGDAILEITQKGKKCHDKCHIYQMVGDCIMPKNGVFGTVEKGANIKIGDKMEVITL